MLRPACAVALTGLLLLPGGARAETIAISGPGGPTMVGAERGWTAWSERRLFGTMWSIVVRAPNGTTSRPVVAPRVVPFDLDLGLDADGDVVAAYSRCAEEPVPFGGANPRAGGGLPQYTTGKGCSIRILDLATGQETDLARAGGTASEVLPAISGRTLAYVALRDGAKNARRAALVVRNLEAGTVRTLHTGRRARGSAGTAVGPSSVDTDGASVTSAWRVRSNRGFRTDVLVQKVSARRATRAASALDPPGAAFSALLAPSLTRRAVSYLSTAGTGFCERRYAGRGRRPAYGAHETGISSPVSAAADGRRLVVAEVYTDGREPTKPSMSGQIVVYDTGRYTATAPAGARCG